MKSKIGITLNTGRTHFKKGNTPWNKGIESHVKPWLGKKRPNVSGEMNYQWKGGLPRCFECDRQLSRYDAKMCTGCRLQSKVSHPRWKGGVTTENQRQRGSLAIQGWRNSVYKRDHFECQFCMNIGGTLNAHHIVKFADCPDRRLDIANGITLCEGCHKSIRSQENEWASLFNFILETQNYKVGTYSD